MLDNQKAAYKAFELPQEKLSALEVAQYLKVAPHQVFKTIVVIREVKGKAILAVLPGTAEVDLKLVARTISEKKVMLPTERAAEKLTGLQAGGISPLALLKKGFQIILDQSATRLDTIYISGGQRGLNIQIPVLSFISITGCQVTSIARECE